MCFLVLLCVFSARFLDHSIWILIGVFFCVYLLCAPLDPLHYMILLGSKYAQRTTGSHFQAIARMYVAIANLPLSRHQGDYQLMENDCK